MPLNSYAELKAAIADYLERTDLTSQIIDFIALAEAEFNRTLFVPQREEGVSSPISSGTVTLPGDFWAMRNVYIDSDPKVLLQQMSLGELYSTYSASATGKPQNFAIQSGTQLILVPAPDAEYTIVLNYYQTIPALADDNESNWLLTDHPDIYLFGSLLQAQYLLLDDTRAGLWRGRLNQAIEQLTDSGSFMAYGGTPLRIRSPYMV